MSPPRPRAGGVESQTRDARDKRPYVEVTFRGQAALDYSVQARKLSERNRMIGKGPGRHGRSF